MSEPTIDGRATEALERIAARSPEERAHLRAQRGKASRRRNLERKRHERNVEILAAWRRDEKAKVGT